MLSNPLDYQIKIIAWEFLYQNLNLFQSNFSCIYFGQKYTFGANIWSNSFGQHKGIDYQNNFSCAHVDTKCIFLANLVRIGLVVRTLIEQDTDIQTQQPPPPPTQRPLLRVQGTPKWILLTKTQSIFTVTIILFFVIYLCENIALLSSN